MKKVKFIITLYIFLLTGLSHAEDMPEFLHIAPYLQNVSDSSIIIMWETTKPFIGEIEYGLSKDNLSFSQKEPTSGKLHEIKLTGLTAGQAYYYRCKWDGEQTQVWHFKTAPAQDTPKVRILTYGDSRSNPGVHHKIAQMVADEHPDLILHSGDFVMYGDDIKSWKPQFFDPIRPFGPEVPILTVLGNHELNAPYYYNSFALNNNEAWWSLDYGPVHIIGLDSNQPGGPGSEQYEWLVNDLRHHKEAKWKIAMFHHPLFNANKWRDTYYLRWHWHPLFEQYGVDLVINGDDHYYCRSFPIGRVSEEQNGVTYIISAGGGAPLYPNTHEDYVAQRRSVHHYTVFDFDGDQMNGRAVLTDGRVFDTWAINKNQIIAPESFVSYEKILLEEQLKKQFSPSRLKKTHDGKISFAGAVKLPHNFGIALNTSIQWRSGTAWTFEDSYIKRSLDPGEPLVIEFSGSAPADRFRPLPTLVIEMNAPEAQAWEDVKLPMGFKNNRVTLDMEDAFYHAIMDRDSRFTRYADAVRFMKLFPDSRYTPDIRKYFFETVDPGDVADKPVINDIREMIKSAKSPREQIQYYPLMFLLGDMSAWDEWINKVEKLSIPERSDMRKSLIALLEYGVLGGGALTDWHIIGPFDNTDDRGFDRVYPPEKGIDLKKTYTGDNGKSIRWKSKQTAQNGLFDFNKIFTNHEYGVVYCYAEIKAERKTRVPLLLGSDDGVVVWLNDREIYRHNEARGVVPGQDFLFVNLDKGVNKLLVKVNQKGGGWGLAVHVLDREKVLGF